MVGSHEEKRKNCKCLGEWKLGSRRYFVCGQHGFQNEVIPTIFYRFPGFCRPEIPAEVPFSEFSKNLFCLRLVSAAAWCVCVCICVCAFVCVRALRARSSARSYNLKKIPPSSCRWGSSGKFFTFSANSLLIALRSLLGENPERDLTL